MATCPRGPGEGGSAVSEANKAIVQRTFEEVVNQQNLAAAEQLYVADYVHHDPSLPPELQRGRDAYLQVIKMFVAAFPDLHCTIEDMIAEGDKVATRVTVRGTHRGELMGIQPTGRKVEFTMSMTNRIAGGKVAEGWVNFDALGMMQQIGAIPAPA